MATESPACPCRLAHRPPTSRARPSALGPCGTGLHPTAANGRRFGIDLTDPQYLKDPALGHFIDEHIVLVPDPAVPRGGAHVALTTRDGQVTDIHQEHALGTPQLPASRGQLADKFRDNARTRLSLQPAEELAAGLNDLDSVGDCADLLGLTRSGSPS